MVTYDLYSSSGAPVPGRERREGVGVRELRQNLSVYLDRVKAGETLEVTEHGHAVALLVPLPPPTSVVARLVAAGRATAARGDLTRVAHATRRTAPAARTPSRVMAALDELRGER